MRHEIGPHCKSPRGTGIGSTSESVLARAYQGDARFRPAGATENGCLCRDLFGPGSGPLGISLTSLEIRISPQSIARCPMSPVVDVTLPATRTHATARRFLRALLRALSTWAS